MVKQKTENTFPDYLFLEKFQELPNFILSTTETRSTTMNQAEQQSPQDKFKKDIEYLQHKLNEMNKVTGCIYIVQVRWKGESIKLQSSNAPPSE